MKFSDYNDTPLSILYYSFFTTDFSSSILFIQAPIHRCRNRGGHDITSCSTDLLPSGKRDLICGEYHSYFKYCHISAFNNPSEDVSYSFTDYEYFTVDSAHATCAEIGGKVPSVKNQFDQVNLELVIKYLSSFVRYNRPYSLKYASWPVSYLNN